MSAFLHPSLHPQRCLPRLILAYKEDGRSLGTLPMSLPGEQAHQMLGCMMVSLHLTSGLCKRGNNFSPTRRKELEWNEQFKVSSWSASSCQQVKWLLEVVLPLHSISPNFLGPQTPTPLQTWLNAGKYLQTPFLQMKPKDNYVQS